jgi:hypothetical protein
MRRAIVLTAMTALVVTACSGGGATAPSAAASAASTAPTVAATATPEPTAAAVTLEYLVDDSQANQQLASAFAKAYTAKHPNVTINVESRPGGTEGDNLVKTKLATGDMTDIFWYNAGSLLQALNPSDTLVDLTGEPFIANIADSFIPTVSQKGGIFGVPSGTAMGGGILYNKKIFADNGLTVPTTWAEFAPTTTSSRPLGSRRSVPRTSPRTTGPRSCSSCPTTATSRRPSRTSPPTTPTTRSSTPTPPQRSLVSSTCRKALTRAGTRRTSGQPASTTASMGSRRASSPSTRC